MYKNDTGKNLYFDSNFQRVEEGSPYAAHVVADGQSLKNEDAAKFGLVAESKPKGRTATASRAVRGPGGRFVSTKPAATEQPATQSQESDSTP